MRLFQTAGLEQLKAQALQVDIVTEVCRLLLRKWTIAWPPCTDGVTMISRKSGNHVTYILGQYQSIYWLPGSLSK